MSADGEGEKIQVEQETEEGETDNEPQDGESDQRNQQSRCGGCFQRINQKRLVSKLFYFFYFSSFGSLWPYLSLYFKQLFISPRQLGILVAVRSLSQFIFTPIWGALADKYNKCKCFLLLSLTFWLISTFSLAIIPGREEPSACYRMNSIHLYSNKTGMGFNLTAPKPKPRNFYERTFGLNQFVPWAMSFFSSSERDHSVDFQELPFPNFKPHIAPQPVADSSALFIGLLVITTIGVIFASPSQCLADTATLQLLGTETHEYGKQALWGSVGYGIVALIVGLAVSGQKRVNPCSNEAEVNYVPCFYVFAVFMISAIFVATQFRYHPSDQGGCRPSLIENLKIFKNCDYAFFLFVVFFCGTATGFIQTFLFWHLRELGGQQVLFSLITFTNSCAEVVFYLFSDRFIRHVGHFKVIYMGLLCYALRFFYYSYCMSPWLFLPIELIQGVTTAAVWSSFVSYVGAEPGKATTLQGLVSGFYTGLGYAIGGLLGGCMVHLFGSNTAFLVFGEMSLIVLFMFVIVNNVRTPAKRPMHRQVISKSENFIEPAREEVEIENSDAKLEKPLFENTDESAKDFEKGSASNE